MSTKKTNIDKKLELINKQKFLENKRELIANEELELIGKMKISDKELELIDKKIAELSERRRQLMIKKEKHDAEVAASIKEWVDLQVKVGEIEHAFTCLANAPL